MENKELAKKGIGLLKVILILFFTVLLVTVAIPVFRFFSLRSELENSAGQIVNTLRTAQKKSLAVEEPDQWGVYFDNTSGSNSYILFQGTGYATREISMDQSYDLPNFIELYDIDLGGKNEIVFSRVTGFALPSGSVGLRLTSDNSKTKTVYINNSGQINLDNFPPLNELRLQDSRHIHLFLNWSIKDSSVLKFYFPGTSQIETVNLATYFNENKDGFDWANTLAPFAAESDHTFRVHSHNLGPSSAILCIHRDRNRETSNRAVIIYIIDEGVEKEVVRYLADGEDNVEKGSFTNEIEKQ